MEDGQDFIQVFEGGHCFLKIVYLDGLRSEVEQFSYEGAPFRYLLVATLPSTRYMRGWLKVNSERGENVG